MGTRYTSVQITALELTSRVILRKLLTVCQLLTVSPIGPWVSHGRKLDRTVLYSILDTRFYLIAACVVSGIVL